MGSKNCPETPRQKMIGMMYLFLTAMLALNVSAEVLQGFTMVNASMRASIASTTERTADLYRDFALMRAEHPEKVEEWYEKATQLRQASDDLYDYIQDFKVQIIRIADGRRADPNAVDIKNRGNLDAAGQFALAEGNGRNGRMLRERLIEHREFLIGLADNDPVKRTMYEALFNVDSVGGRSWEQSMFQMMPLSAAVTMLTKYQNDIRTAEMDMVQFLQRRTDADDFRVNRVEAFVIPSSRHIMQGGTYRAQIVLAAIDTTAQPEFFIGDRQLRRDGLFGIHEIHASQVGTFSYNGIVRFRGNDGEPIDIPFREQFTVGAPAATISNIDLNVVYRGIDNRFSISVPGVAAENVRVTAEGANVRQSGANYIINPTQNQNIRIIVSAIVEGREIQMGSQEYRVRQIPDPKAFLQYRDQGGVVRTIGQVEVGRLSKAAMRSSDFTVIASYGPDELIQANFEVVSFSISTLIGNVEAQGNKLTARQLQDIDRLERGQPVTFNNIQARGPDGTIRRLGMLQVTVN
jgi:gliding motility-associated protein GldM